MNNNTGNNMAIVVVSAFIMRLIFGSMGNSNESVIIKGTIFIVLCAILAYYMTHGVNKKRLGNKLGIIRAILVLVVGISNSLAYIMMENYHQIYMENKILNKILNYTSYGSGFALVIFFMVAAGIVSDREK